MILWCLIDLQEIEIAKKVEVWWKVRLDLCGYYNEKLTITCCVFSFWNNDWLILSMYFLPVPSFNLDVKNHQMLDSYNVEGRYGTSKKHHVYHQMSIVQSNKFEKKIQHPKNLRNRESLSLKMLRTSQAFDSPYFDFSNLYNQL